VARGTVVGWAPLRDTGSLRLRWWGTAGSLLPGVARGQVESRPPRVRLALGPSRPGWRGVVQVRLVQRKVAGSRIPAACWVSTACIGTTAALTVPFPPRLRPKPCCPRGGRLLDTTDGPTAPRFSERHLLPAEDLQELSDREDGNPAIGIHLQ